MKMKLKKHSIGKIHGQWSLQIILAKNKKIIEEQFTTHKKLLDKFIIENKE